MHVCVVCYVHVCGAVCMLVLYACVWCYVHVCGVCTCVLCACGCAVCICVVLCACVFCACVVYACGMLCVCVCGVHVCGAMYVCVLYACVCGLCMCVLYAYMWYCVHMVCCVHVCVVCTCVVLCAHVWGVSVGLIPIWTGPRMKESIIDGIPGSRGRNVGAGCLCGRGSQVSSLVETLWGTAGSALEFSCWAEISPMSPVLSGCSCMKAEETSRT